MEGKILRQDSHDQRIEKNPHEGDCEELCSRLGVGTVCAERESVIQNVVYKSAGYEAANGRDNRHDMGKVNQSDEDDVMRSRSDGADAGKSEELPCQRESPCFYRPSHFFISKNDQPFRGTG